ncbi:Dolichyl-diphosphooligosaccharide--protein glycosyltransferase subunit 2 [Dichanthelium oligosanthes]|uniref:Dolichyl-diphosphooligosaccharide--protein glycosyltransferase subunit 2 n=1 Tax=Dichanthelium oligosanthes TaxID=888268 RepID=A0A1E5VVF0_9POAL|nr:Dolichyl-diphosphooligosaccharide--protein glycosyltransferase subunit 2 [Dichanthelium oligosanthes]
MAGRCPVPAALLFLLIAAVFAPISAVRPVSDAHRSAAAELFAPSADGSFGDLERTYEAARTFQILGLEKYKSLTGKACKFAAEDLASPASSAAKDLFHAIRISGALGCSVDAAVYDEQGHSVVLSEAESTFHAIKALSQSDGRWRSDTNSAESSTFAAGNCIALEALAGVVSLADAEVDPSMIGVVKNDIMKLFDTIKSYDDGTFYFDEKHVDGTEYKGPIMTSASVVRGVTSFATVASGKLNVSIANSCLLFTKSMCKHLSYVTTLKSTDPWFFWLIYFLHFCRVFIPLILSLPSKVFSLTSKDQLKVEVTTVFGSAAPPLKVNLVQVLGSDSKVITSENKELQFDLDNNVHYLDIAPLKIDVGKYSLVFEVLCTFTILEPEHETVYATGARNTENVFITGLIKVDKAEIGISDNDAGAAESVQKLDLLKDTKVSLSANHLQKLRLSFQLTTPLGHTFKPHQVFLKLKHESNVEHLFVVTGSARQFKIVLVESPPSILEFSLLDFLGLVEKFYYLSGRYDLELAVGDAAMENSFRRPLGHLELDLPEAPEKAPRPPAQAVDPFSKFGPKAEISHIFRAPEKRPPKELSLAFMGLTLVPFALFLIGLLRMGVNLKNFPSLPGPAAFASLFHAGIGAVLLLYVLFWLKLDLFTTLKYLGLLSIFLVFVGHRTLSYLSSASTKQKTA